MQVTACFCILTSGVMATALRAQTPPKCAYHPSAGSMTHMCTRICAWQVWADLGYGAMAPTAQLLAAADEAAGAPAAPDDRTRMLQSAMDDACRCGAAVFAPSYMRAHPWVAPCIRSASLNLGRVA